MYPDRPPPGRRALFAAAGGFACVTAGLAPAAAAVEPGEELVIATVGHGFVAEALSSGAVLKVEQLNAAGGVLGHKLRIHRADVIFDRRRPRAHAIEVARELLSLRGLIAVLGHQTVEDALPAAISYLSAGVILIAPAITSTGLTMHGLKNLFATLPDNSEVSVQTARIVFDIGHRRCVILRDRGTDALEISLAYRDEAAVLGITIVDERSHPHGTSPRVYFAGLQGLRFDHLLIIGSMDLQINLVKFASDLGISVTCVLPTIVNVEYMREQMGQVLPRVLIPVLRDRSSPSPPQAAWEKEYLARFGTRPLDVAIQGTDAVGLIADGLVRVGSVNPAELGRVLHNETAYRGIGGRLSFRQNGRIYTRLLSFASIRTREIAYYAAGA